MQAYTNKKVILKVMGDVDMVIFMFQINNHVPRLTFHIHYLPIFELYPLFGSAQEDIQFVGKVKGKCVIFIFHRHCCLLGHNLVLCHEGVVVVEVYNTGGPRLVCLECKLLDGISICSRHLRIQTIWY